MNTLHLLWIVPVAAAFGFAVCACMAAASDADRAFEKAEETEVKV